MNEPLTRRQALTVVGTIAVIFHGKTVTGQQRGITLTLDDVDAIVLRHRGRTVAIAPSQILDALEAPPSPFKK